jgi:DNA repair protein RecO (recombination protein O)
LGLKKTKGIVISAKDMGEKDRVITLLGLDSPRQNYLVRGIRKSKTRPIAAGEIGSIVEINFYDREGKDWKDVKEIFLSERFDSIKSSALGLYFISYLFEILGYLLPEGEEHFKEAKLMELALREVEQNGFYFGILPFLKSRLFLNLGLLSGELHCEDCGEDIREKTAADYLERNFEIHCSECRTLERNRISHLRLLKDMLRLRYGDLFQQNISQILLKDLDRSLNAFLEAYLQRHLKTEKEFYRLLENELVS